MISKATVTLGGGGIDSWNNIKHARGLTWQPQSLQILLEPPCSLLFKAFLSRISRPVHTSGHEWTGLTHMLPPLSLVSKKAISSQGKDAYRRGLAFDGP